MTLQIGTLFILSILAGYGLALFRRTNGQNYCCTAISSLELILNTSKINVMHLRHMISTLGGFSVDGKGLSVVNFV